MIMFANKKKLIGQIMGDPEEHEEVEGQSALHSCIEELISAIHAHDVEGAVSAFKACVSECAAEPNGDSPTEEY